MIIALPATDHEHLADALVRDLGFTRTHVDQPLRDLLLALDPLVDSGLTMANKGTSPRLSSKLEQLGGPDPEDRWNRLLNPPRPGSSANSVATEVRRLLDVLRESGLVELPAYGPGDTVCVGATGIVHSACRLVAISGRFDSGVTPDHWITPAGVVGEQEAVVAYVRELREARPTVAEFEESLREPEAWPGPIHRDAVRTVVADAGFAGEDADDLVAFAENESISAPEMRDTIEQAGELKDAFRDSSV